ncbi:hypothetical protein N9W31_00445 [Litoricolaceae bacterium]|nr:hypothetical protein [Litorivicinaceae bacterium]
MLEKEAADLFREALHFEEVGNKLAASQIYERLLHYFPARSSVLINLSENYITLKNDKRLKELLPKLEVIEHPLAKLNAGTIYYNQQRRNIALEFFQKAFDLDPNNQEILQSLAVCLFKLKKPQLAAEFAEKLAYLSTSPIDFGRAAYYYASACDWPNELRIRSLTTSIFPFFGISRNLYEHQNLSDAEAYAPKEKVSLALNFDSYVSLHDLNSHKLRIGYLCGEFREHATLKLLISVFEHHAHETFEVFYLDNGISDNSIYRQRLEATSGTIISIRDKSDTDVLAEIKRLKIDLLVNLNGYFGNGRNELFFGRAAPIQVSYLGYPGTLGHPNIDYLIADSVTIPDENLHYFTERIYRLPSCYQPNDDKRPKARPATREKYGLPEGLFIFCCLNNSYKLTRDTFEAWATILQKSVNTSLLLLADNDDAKRNIIEAAEAFNVGDRICFIERLPTLDYVDLLSLCDLFLDTSPYNAHTTASDALWAGTPILTMPGETFPSRVAHSLILRAGLDAELYVASSRQDYITKALFLTENPQIVEKSKAFMRTKIDTEGGFVDMLTYTKHLEEAYISMFQTYLKEWKKNGQ